MKELFNGYVKIRVSGESKERFLNMCRMKKIRMWDLKEVSSDTASTVPSIVMCMESRDLLNAKSAIHKSGIRVHVLEKNGLPFFVRHVKKRIVFAAGVLFCIAFLIAMMQKIWCIRIEGNQKVTNEELISFLAELEVGIGCNISDLSYEDLEFEIRERFSEITWVSVVRKGTTLIVRLKENEFYNKMAIYEDHTDLTADYDGIILSMVVRQGVPLVRIGDTVAKGDILVQGAVPILDENAQICKYQYCHAQADILIRTTQQYVQTLNRVHEVRVYGTPVHTYQLGFGTHLLNIGKKAGAELVLTQKQVHQFVLFDYLYLPFYFNRIESVPYEITEETYTKEEAEALLLADLEKYLCELSEKGVQIVQNNVKIIENGLTMQIVAELTLDRSVGISTETTVELTEYDENNN